ncbi:hypothetical protein [Nocardiopsis ganjiahuensis]|uniref:hypothetical protein n=1 Tax=Nocardiopsis ganjiahuensis TaxID=239984 RepID=UPI0003460F63|nr:hypothetical protein [Nocardiopsis ganjiahuensis]
MQRVNALRNSPRAPSEPAPHNVLTLVVAAAAPLLTCALFGSAAFLTWLGARAAWLMLPTSLGVPFAFPRLTFRPLVGQPGWHLGTELLAAVVLAAVAAWWVHRALLRRPGADPWRLLLSAWAGTLLGLALANALRAVAAVLAAGAGPLPFLSYAFAGALTGVLWALCLGWVCAVPVALVHRFTARTRSEPAPA